MSNLTYKSVEQTRTFEEEGLAIVLEKGLEGWESVKAQLEQHRMWSPREATVAFWGITDALDKRKDEFVAKHGGAAWASLDAAMKPYRSGALLRELQERIAEHVKGK